MSKWRLLSPEALRTAPEPGWVLRGVLPSAGSVVLYGPPGIGKSFLALDWGLCVAMGREWEKRAVASGSVVYICAENAWATWKRMAAWGRLRGAPIPEEQLFVLTPDSVNLCDPKVPGEFVGAIQEHQRAVGFREPALVIIDTLQRTMVGFDENASADMTRWCNGLQVLVDAFPRACILVVHHVGKDLTRGSRGSTVLLASVEASLELTGNPKSREAALVCRKQKNAEEFPTVLLERQPDELKQGWVFQIRGFSEFELSVLDTLRVEGGKLSQTQLRKLLGDCNLGKLKGALRRLQGAGKVAPEGRGWIAVEGAESESS